MLDLTDMNDVQRRAVTHGGGPLLVLAGPGSGKTFTITRRILYLLEQGVPPERILVVTFTREAAQSMERRFQKMVQSPRPVNFGTFHSIFFQILRKSNVLKSTEILNDSGKKELMIPILRKQQEQSGKEASPEELREDAAVFLAAVSYYKNTLAAGQAARKAPPQYQEDFVRLFKEYQQAVRVCGKLDFDDMLVECRRFLAENSGMRENWQEHFDHILIDEFQDINPIQYEVVKLLAGKKCSIFAVGDDDQAIYGFRGSEPECLRRFEREYEAEKLLLDVNYRSGPEIVSASLAVIGDNKERFEKTLRPNPERKSGNDSEKVRLCSFEGSEEQYLFLIRRLEEFLREDKKIGSAECAVLFRTNAGMQKLALRLRAAGIGYEMSERMQSIYRHFVVRDVMAYLLLASGVWEREMLLRIINRPSRYVSREAVGKGVRSVGELQRYYRGKTDMPEKTRKNILDALGKLERQLEAIGRLSPGLAVSYVQKAVGYERYLRLLAGKNREKWEEWQEIMEWLKADASKYSSLREWQEAQEMYTEELERGKKKKDTAGVGVRIRLMTVHGSKGLEFDTVILPDCNEGVFPHGRFQSESELEEERRIFYVAMTRAKECLELLYLTGTGDRPRLPSRFLRPLLQDHSSTSSSNSQLSRYSSKASATFSYSSSSSIKTRSGSSLGSSGFSL